MNRAVSRVRRAEDEKIFVSSHALKEALLVRTFYVLLQETLDQILQFEKASVFACLRR